MHVSEHRVKDVFTDERRCTRWLSALVAQTDDVPLLGALRTSAVVGASLVQAKPARSDGPTKASRSAATPRRACNVAKARMPFTVASKELERKMSPSLPFLGPLAHAAHNAFVALL